MAKAKMNWLDYVAIILLIVGGINWGLVGFFKFDLLVAIFNTGWFTNVLYDLVGISAVYSIYTLWIKK